MKHRNQRLVGVLITVSLGLILAVLVLPRTGSEAAESATSHSAPAVVEPIDGSSLSRVILSAKAAERLGVQTAPVVDETINGTPRKVIPYASVLYDPSGGTWTYTSPAPLTYVRQSITVDRIEGDRAILTDGPATDTAVVVVGVAEIFGAESGVGH